MYAIILLSERMIILELFYKITSKDNYYNVRDVLKNYFKISSRLIFVLKSNNCITLNNKQCDLKKLIKENDEITVSLDFDEDNSNIVPTKINLDIIFEDNSFLIVNKTANIAVHPSIAHYSDSLSNGIKYYFDSINLKKKIRPVNRLDRDTSGLVIFAKNQYVQEQLIKQMQDKIFKKEYLGILDGTLDKKTGTIDAPIARKEGSIIERCIAGSGKTAITHYEVIKEFSDYSLVKCLLETGRTHQIRVHFASIGHPLIGDSLYGEKSNLRDGQALTCVGLTFVHPINKKIMEFKIPFVEI